MKTFLVNALIAATIGGGIGLGYAASQRPIEIAAPVHLTQSQLRHAWACGYATGAYNVALASGMKVDEYRPIEGCDTDRKEYGW